MAFRRSWGEVGQRFMTTLLLVSDDPAWPIALQQEFPGIDIRKYPNIGDPGNIDYALVWAPEPGLLARLPRLQVIFSLAAGVDHILRDPELPRDIPIVRMSDPYQCDMLAEYACMAVLYHHRFLDRTLALQARAQWEEQPVRYTPDVTVGILGLGAIGQAIAARLAGFGFAINGWSRTARRIDGIACHHGPAQLREMLPECQYVICALPQTPETTGLIDAAFLARMPRGGYVINVGRGAHLVDADLLAALDSGRIAGAFLDVFSQEPLPEDHAFWHHPRIVVTPHMAGELLPRTAVRSIARGIRDHQAGKPLAHVYDSTRGY